MTLRLSSENSLLGGRLIHARLFLADDRWFLISSTCSVSWFEPTVFVRNAAIDNTDFMDTDIPSPYASASGVKECLQLSHQSFQGLGSSRSKPCLEWEGAWNLLQRDDRAKRFGQAVESFCRFLDSKYYSASVVYREHLSQTIFYKTIWAVIFGTKHSFLFTFKMRLKSSTIGIGLAGRSCVSLASCVSRWRKSATGSWDGLWINLYSKRRLDQWGATRCHRYKEQGRY